MFVLAIRAALSDDPAATWHHASAVINETEIKWSISTLKDDPVAATPDPRRIKSGRTFSLSVPARTKVALRNVKFKPSGQKPIFNGKNLTDWNETHAIKSQFWIADNGQLNMKGGPGEIEAKNEWSDFVMQLTIRSNSDHGKAGVLIRRVRGQVSSGYETQIHSQWEGTDRTRPAEYGTGGICSHQAARKVVAKDCEWFTMTIVAHGTHIATWVDGYQVTDFTDTRPLRNDARTGSMVANGPISLKGYDAKTDISIRDLRIAE
jgi:hypothetical protein